MRKISYLCVCIIRKRKIHSYYHLRRKTMASDFNTMVAALPNLNNDQKKDLAVKTLGTLPQDDKSEVADRTGLGRPSQGPTDMIWVIIVITFALVLVGAAGSILYGVVFLGQTADKVQIVLTIFTTVAGFIAGLISPSPFQGNKSNNP
jgi:hypothetical protein